MDAPSWTVQFLTTLAATANVSEACRAAGISRPTSYRLLERDKEFAADWRDAMASSVDALESEARRRAVEGVEEPLFQKGAKVGTIRRYSDALLMFLLRAAKPDRYGDSLALRQAAKTPEHEDVDLDQILAAMGYELTGRTPPIEPDRGFDPARVKAR